nr:hypothetical protein [Dyella sp. ASV24]
MTTSRGDGIVKEFYQHGAGELAAAYRKADSPASVAAATRPPVPAGKTAAKKPAELVASGKQRKRTRDQRLVLALARLLASRTR